MAQEKIKGRNKCIDKKKALPEVSDGRLSFEQINRSNYQQINMTVDAALVQTRFFGKSMRTNGYAVFVVGQYIMEVNLWRSTYK